MKGKKPTLDHMPVEPTAGDWKLRALEFNPIVLTFPNQTRVEEEGGGGTAQTHSAGALAPPQNRFGGGGRGGGVGCSFFLLNLWIIALRNLLETDSYS
jgi:hypothetical protein